jgi:hypothetical protein
MDGAASAPLRCEGLRSATAERVSMCGEKELQRHRQIGWRMALVSNIAHLHSKIPSAIIHPSNYHWHTQTMYPLRSYRSCTKISIQ